MKVAIASDNGITISSHFGRTLGFEIFEIENGVIVNQLFRKNDFTGHARGMEGAGHHADHHGPILEALKDCNVVIAHGMGRRIYDDLQRAGIETFIVEENDTKQAIQLYMENKLQDHPEKGCEH
jgi:predicted Fe-Mo cluster-binding NifX family protein